MSKIASVRQYLKQANTRLAITYLAIIMLMSIGFSVVLYITSSDQLAKQVPTQAYYQNGDTFGFTSFIPNYDLFFHNRINQGRHALFMRLVLLNLATLAAGSLVSYVLARRTLRPIEENMEAQSQFVSDASHELRTPLTAIQATNEVALRKPKLSLTEAKRIIEHNTADVVKLKELSESLLHLAKQNKKGLVLSPVSLQETTAEAINQIIPEAQAKAITINDEVPNIKVLANPSGLVQVIVILLDNAIKYSESKTAITLDGSSKGKFAYLNVRDQGAGIRATDLPHIFKRFYRADRSRSKEQPGYGLGLSIADKLIQQQHGKISASSNPKQGSTFTLRLLLA